jgi:hypothetical protein
VFEPALVTYTKPLVGLIATPDGPSPTGIVATTVLVLGSITETVFELALATYTKPLVGLIATPNGLLPTGIVAITEYFCALAVPISEENTIVDISNVIVKSENNIREMVVFIGVSLLIINHLVIAATTAKFYHL